MGNIYPQSNFGCDAYRLAIPLIPLFVPLVASAWYRQKALRQSAESAHAIWFGYRGLKRFVILTILACWWSIWDLGGGWLCAFKAVFPTWPVHTAFLFAAPPIASCFLLQILDFSTDKKIADLHWSQSAILRRALWSVVQHIIPTLMIAAGFEALFLRTYFGIFWIAAAAVVHRIGMVFVRRAEGMRFNRLKSGELRNRSLAMARKMGITLRDVCMVPAGKGHLTNAYGGGRMIALTDALPKYLNDKQIDSVIAHELIHVRRKHARTESLLVIAAFTTLGVLAFAIDSKLVQCRPLFDLVIVYGPMIGFYGFSRHAEFEADREAVLQTGDPETAIRALANLYKSSGVPIRSGRLSELFQTHPSLSRRVIAIAQVGELPLERQAKILKEVNLSEMPI